jgi:hypothetical protein
MGTRQRQPRYTLAPSWPRNPRLGPRARQCQTTPPVPVAPLTCPYSRCAAFEAP